jgi:hypothetical protein
MALRLKKLKLPKGMKVSTKPPKFKIKGKSGGTRKGPDNTTFGAPGMPKGPGKGLTILRPKRKRKPRRDAPPVPLPQMPGRPTGRTIKIGNIKRKTKKAPKLSDLSSGPPKGPFLGGLRSGPPKGPLLGAVSSGPPKGPIKKLKKGPARSRKPRAGQEVPMARKRRAVRRRRRLV